MGIDGDNLKVYDPYLYNGKFNTSTRKGKATLNGNTVYVSKSNFKKYANAQSYFCYKNNRTDVKEIKNNITINESTATVKKVNYKVKVTASAGLRIRSGASTSYKRLGAYSKNTTVTIIAQNKNWGKTDKGWICLDYTKKVTTSTLSTNTKTVNAKAGLVLRKIAGTNGKKILTIPYNKKVTITTLNYTTKNGYVWSKVKYGKYTGYVAKKYLK